jgi:type II secretory pathway predicted ATPase ExeA
MYGEMMQYYGLVKDFDKTDYYESEAFKGVLGSLEIAVLSGGIIALTGFVGIGKTTIIRHFQDSLKKKNQVIVAKSLAPINAASTSTPYIPPCLPTCRRRKTLRCQPRLKSGKGNFRN